MGANSLVENVAPKSLHKLSYDMKKTIIWGFVGFLDIKISHRCLSLAQVRAGLVFKWRQLWSSVNLGCGVVSWCPRDLFCLQMGLFLLWAVYVSAFQESGWFVSRRYDQQRHTRIMRDLRIHSAPWRHPRLFTSFFSAFIFIQTCDLRLTS